jgi:excisionase family DNA binding protein
MNGFYRHDPGRPNASQAGPLALRPRQAASSIGVSLSTLERLTRAGELAVVKLGRCRLYEVSALEAFLKSRRVSGQEVAS